MDNNHLTIVMIAGHACIRVQKQALALIDRGHNVHLIAKKIPLWHESYASFTMTPGMNHYIEAIKIYSHVADVFHCHNEPSHFVTAVKEHSEVPVILDVHDSYTQRLTPDEEEKLRDSGVMTYRITSEERNNFQLADGLVFCAPTFGENIKREFKLEQPSICLPSYLPRSLYQYNGAGYMGGLVYEGRVDLKEDIEKSPMSAGFSYTDYEAFAKKADELGIQFHIYSIREEDAFKKVYDDIAFCHSPRHMPKLMKSLTRHDWGLVGNLFPTTEWKIGFPNKMFEYIGAGVPIVAINADECARFVEEHEIGIAVDSLEQLCERWAEHERCRRNLLVKRQSWTMDAHIHELEGLYHELCAVHSIRDNG